MLPITTRLTTCPIRFSLTVEKAIATGAAAHSPTAAAETADGGCHATPSGMVSSRRIQ